MASFLSTQVRNFLCCTDGLIDASSIGAVGDGVTNNTAALQTALNDTTSNGVAITVPGTYLVSNLLTSSGASPTAPNSTFNAALTIPSNKTLYLARGVTLKLKSQSNCYLLANTVPTINGATAGNSNISVIGEGTIDANGGFHLPPYPGSPGAGQGTSWTEGSKTLTCTGAFANYTWTSGDTFQPTKFGIAALTLTTTNGAPTVMTTASGTPFTNFALSGTTFLNVTSCLFGLANTTITSATNSVITKTNGFTNYNFRAGDTITVSAGTASHVTTTVTRKLDASNIEVATNLLGGGSTNNTISINSQAARGTYTVSATNASTTITVPTIPALNLASDMTLTFGGEVMQVPAANPSFVVSSKTSSNAIVLSTSPFLNKAWNTVYGDLRTQTGNASDTAAATRWIGHCLSFTGVDNLTVGGMRIINCFKYGLVVSNFTNLYCPPITYYNTLSGSDGTHLIGPGSSFEIDAIFGTTGDNMFACGATSGTYFNSQELAAYGSGNLTNGHAGQIQTVNGFEPVRFFGDTTTTISGIRIDYVGGSVTSGSAVNLIDDSVGALNGCIIFGVSIGTIETTHTSFDNVLNTSPMLSISCTGTRDLTVENLLNYNVDRCESINIGSSGAGTAVVLDRLNIKNLLHGTSTARSYTRALRVYELAGITGLTLNLSAWTNTNTLIDLVGYIRGGTITLHEDMIGPGTTINFATPTTAVTHNFAVTGYIRHASPQGNNTWITCNKATAVVHANNLTFDNNGIYSIQLCIVNHANADLTIAGSGITYIRGSSNPSNVFVVFGATGNFNVTNPDFYQPYSVPAIASGAAATSFMDITTALNHTYNLTAWITCRRNTGGNEGGAWIFSGTFSNNAGTLAQIGTTTAVAANKDATIAAPTLTMATNVLSLNAVGATGYTTKWNARISLQRQGQ